MLVVSRTVGQKLVIANNIVVTFVAIQGTKIRLGIEAPKNVPIHREEVWLEILKQKFDGSAASFGHD